MISVHHSRIGVTTEPLEESLPPGMFSADGPPGAQNAVRALRIIEAIILDSSTQNALGARYSLLQSFPRLLDRGTKQASDDRTASLRQYALALSPSWYGEFIAELTEDEVEILLKHTLHGHELWGHPEGVGALVRSMLENSLHAPVPLVVERLHGQERAIPAQQQSLLGRQDRYSSLGRDFLLGTRVLCRPEEYEIRIGPVSAELMEAFRRSGWAEGSKPSYKLIRLTEFAEPFYLRARIRFLFESSETGFVLSRAILGRGGLGRSASM
jgi:hypothetical protein